MVEDDDRAADVDVVPAVVDVVVVVVVVVAVCDLEALLVYELVLVMVEHVFLLCNGFEVEGDGSGVGADAAAVGIE